MEPVDAEPASGDVEHAAAGLFALGEFAAALDALAPPLLSAMPTDWRWMKTGDTTPWYPSTTRLFRQTSVDEDWAHVVERVRQACINALPQLPHCDVRT